MKNNTTLLSSAQVAAEVEREITTIAEAITKRVLARLAIESDVSTNFSSPCLPPGVPRRTFRMRCAAGLVEGAVKNGHVWRCSQRAWYASFATATTYKAKPANGSVDDEALALVRAAGFRGTR